MIQDQALEGFRLSPQQKRLWELQQRDGTFHTQSAFLAEGELDRERLRRSFQQAVCRHEVFRTVFERLAGLDLPMQVVRPELPAAYAEIDLEPRGEQDVAALARELFRREREAGLDLESGPLVRLTLARLGPQRHLLCLTTPTLCGDLRSHDNLIGEIGLYYDAAGVAGEVIQYVDVCEWQHELLGSEEAGEGRRFWRGQLPAEPASGRLFAENGHDPAAPCVPRRLAAPLGRELLAGVERLARERRVRTEAVLLAAWLALLSRSGLGETVAVGRLSAGRQDEILAGVQGLLARCLPLGFRLGPRKRFADLLAEVERALAGSEEWQELLSWEDLGDPCLPYGFEHQSAAGSRQLGGAQLAPLCEESRLEPFTVQLRSVASGRGLDLELWHDAARVSAEEAELLLERLAALLGSALDNPAAPLAGLALLGAADGRRLAAWNDTALEVGLHGPVHRLFEARAARDPEAEALVWGGERLTYGALNAQANRLARRLLRAGSRPGGRVVLALERSAAQIVALLASWKAGAAFVPLDPLQPAPRLARMLEDATGDGTPAVVVTTAARAPLLPATALAVVVLDGLGDLAEESAADLPVEVPAEAPAYILFTSGSTGRPKGAVIRHVSVVNMAEAFRRQVYGALATAGERLRVSVSAPLAFDGSIKQIVQLAYGHALFLVPEETRRDPAALVAFVCEHRLDVLDCTPAQAGPLLDAGLFADKESAPRLTLLGGDKIVAPLWERLSGHPERIVYNLYGPTECTVDSTAERVGAVPFPCIGRSFPNVRTWVVDAALQPVPPGVWGELLIGGAGLALGYVGRPGLTAERFLPDPFAAEPGGRLYRTGDRVRWLADGRLVCHGRLDDQVKLRGFRIELGEIESALAEHPGVARAVAVLREDGDGDGSARLVAYVTPRTADGAGAGPLPPGSSDDLRDFVRRRLPDYMVPSAVVVLLKFPLNRNGKVDRAALPAPEELLAAAARPVAAPRNPFEEVLSGIWAELLGRPRVGIDESFFELGGHSLVATQLVSRVRQAFHIELPLRALFEGPTVARLAERVEAAFHAGAGIELPPVRPVPRDRELPLSFAQQRLWFLWQLEPESPVYNNPKALRISGALDPGLIERTLGEIVRRHEVLRTTFPAADGRPAQRIDPAARLALPVQDLSALPDPEEEARRAARAEALAPFDLAREIPVRGRLLRLAARDHVLLLSTHHIASDAWSLGVLEREVTALYAAFAAGRPSPLPELPVQYADFAAWQREWLQGEVLERQLAAWREQLAGALPLLPLPLDRPRPPVASSRGELLRLSLPPALARSLAELCQRRALTLFMPLLAGFQALLARLSGQPDVSVGTPIAGRRHVETEGLIGFFVNTLVMRSRVDAGRSFEGLLGQVRDLALAAYAHQDLPFERLVEELSPERSLAHTPLFQVMLILQNVERSGVRVGDLELSPFGAEAGVAKFDLLLSVTEEDGELHGLFEYRAGLFDRTTVLRLAAHLVSLLESAAAAPETLLCDLAVLTPAERHQLRAEWNDTAVEPGPGATLLDGIEAQVKRAPGAVAVSFEGESLTYAELDRRAERLARRLARLGVGPEARVAICAGRSPRLLVAMLGVLKAGGAWVPLDPAHPQERLDLILEDCGARVVLSERELALLDAEPDEEPAGPLCRALPENLAYVIYTSGSTGRPKGVEVRHRAVANYLAAMAARPGLEAGAVMMAVTTVSFDIAVTELLLPLTVGARIELVGRETAGDAALLAAALESSGATCLQATPATWTLLVDGGWPGRPGLRALCGGEALPRGLADRLLPRVAELWNVYGPTETTVWSAALRVGPGEGPVPAGGPLANTTLYVLSRHGELVPVGVAGELAIGGEGLARGYHGRPDLTAGRFVPDPSGAAGARLYRTGDLARRLADGRLEILGRTDHQVKIRGFRIELGEIEAALLAQPGIREAVAVVREDRPGDRRLVAYVAGDAVESSALRERLGDRLPAVMVPAVFVALNSLPKNPNGKVDRRALPAPEEPGPAKPGAAPRDPFEEVIAGLWAELLGRPRVGVDESFFALGGHSLLAMRLASRLREVFGVELRVRALFEGPTVAELAQRVREAVHAGAGSELPPIRPVPRDGELPLSVAQQRLWFLWHLEPESPAYNLTGALRIEGPLDVAAAGRTLSEIVHRHEVLRTTFPVGAGRPVQRIGPAAPFALPVEDLSALFEPVERARERFRAEA
ncbi:MAG TPA: amino acid adenylation domain-containing protein, partial [Thermoanaerobaculia bacterium]|nr:amino acid adenylation domain-containing protein [Thermoanaerobaculia bacterium]